MRASLRSTSEAPPTAPSWRRLDVKAPSTARSIALPTLMRSSRRSRPDARYLRLPATRERVPASRLVGHRAANGYRRPRDVVVLGFTLPARFLGFRSAPG